MNPGKCSEAIRAFVQANPGCTRDQAKAAVGAGRKQFGMAFRTMRKRGLLVDTAGALTLGRPPTERKAIPVEEAKARALKRNRERKRRLRAEAREATGKSSMKLRSEAMKRVWAAKRAAKNLARGVQPTPKPPRPPKPPKAARPPKPPKAKPMPAPKPLHPIQAANDAAWALAQDKRIEARKVRVETYDEFCARGGKKIVLAPAQYVAPSAMPYRQAFRGKGSMG
jgi:hypothetical protein